MPFIFNFAARKSINIRLDPSDVFNVQIITPSRYVSITSDFLRRIYSLMGYILSIISDPSVKSRERIFLKDEINTLSKTTYRGENMLEIESHLRQGCHVLLSRQNLLRLQDMQWAIDESIARKSNVVRCAVMEQTDLIASYLSMNVYVEKTAYIEEMIAATRNIHNNLHTMNIIPESQCSFINQLILFANKQLALCWSANVHASSAHCLPNSDSGGGGGSGVNRDTAWSANVGDTTLHCLANSDGGCGTVVNRGGGDVGVREFIGFHENIDPTLLSFMQCTDNAVICPLHSINRPSRIQGVRKNAGPVIR
ncbi:uncharacterized protein LOC126554424 [Aphis gossypii]|uniref:uncharacterized protein LOC126554424 n=1 Tax=Aphis gossypii TaxID=80765 RepID=UPI0021595BB4|nr:uncharacterized protein LOC126554424 [Aphis gossypii]